MAGGRGKKKHVDPKAVEKLARIGHQHIPRELCSR
jgi:hypothetical protein